MGIREIKINNFNSDMKLAEDIYSSLGGVLYKKGTILKERDKEILEAFGVIKFRVEESSELNKVENIEQKQNQETNQYEEKTLLFQKQFQQTAGIIDQLLKAARGKTDVSILVLRDSIQPLLDKLNDNPKQILSINNSILNSDQYHSYHSLYVGLMSYLMAKWVDMNKNDWMPIALAGVLHDIGMSRIPDQITFNKGKLTYYELDEIKKHPVYGYEILKGTIGLNKGTLLAILQHHEREDGSGYPLKIKKDQIHTYAKIIAIMDVLHAMISRRTYRQGYTLFNTLDYLVKESYQKLDIKLVHILVQKISQLTISERVRLSDGRQGVIMFVDQQHPTRPWIKIDNDIVNLIHEKGIFVEELIIS